MKKYILAILTLVVFNISNAQEPATITYPNQSTVITTGVPFMLIAPDARSAGMGDMGVATSVDAYSQQWNAAKYAFSEAKSGIAVSYTPYLSKLVNDISIAYLTYFNRIDDRSAFGVSFKYFGLGEIEIRADEFSEPLIEKPNEFTVDASYSLRLADQFSMAVALRYLRSDLRIQSVDANAGAAGSFGVDISGFYQSEEEAYDSFNGRTRFGFAIQNLGPKIKYDDGGRENFLPTNLRLGGGFDFIFDDYNTLSVTAEITKLLVPTPPLFGFVDTNGDGVRTPDDASTTDIDENEPEIITQGQANDVNFLSGVFQSFGDAPGGFSEELKEFTWALGAEYLYQDSFAFRLGYFNESDDKGARKFFAMGAGFKYTTINIDLSYLFSASKVQSPLENTLRFSLTFNFGDGEYDEY
ncbi:type IX secretion system outer membrane channel protein PorV [Psychroserpens burtonensis]|uniref:Type IX secretion system outer membrane channel protein PorV n=1 Tax=Psychroserpens burtonensis TaxID=49278 RepID=A0A5C7B3I4_9FLAO|nr:type IX secretion system outer membrane channel protein PorV [Psychroserpens burtonensis]TXE15540.1 type IX secretion system outer membrane channel protein PorV [Psychroserpens burtonensis]